MKSIFSPALGSLLCVASATLASSFPGPGPSPSANFTATLTGASAIPPNNSPLSTVGAVYGPFPFPITPFAYTIYVLVDLHSSPLIGYDKILPESVSLQRQDGTPVTDGYYPLTLTRIPGPLYPCYNTSNGWVCPPAFTLAWDGRFGITDEQVTELTSGQWYLNATFVTSNGLPIPDYTIRGQILPVPIHFQVVLTGAKDVPPNQSGDTASGVLSLSGNSLTYQIRVSFWDWTGKIHGPAEPGSSAPLIFDLGVKKCAVPNPPRLGGCVFTGSVMLSDEQVAQLLAGLWYVRVNRAARPDLGLRAQIILDADGDGVPDDHDECPGTESGASVDDNGCSIEQLCPCNGPWQRQLEYVKCVKTEALRFFKEGRITQAERHAIVWTGQGSSGKATGATARSPR